MSGKPSSPKGNKVAPTGDAKAEKKSQKQLNTQGKKNMDKVRGVARVNAHHAKVKRKKTLPSVRKP